MSIAPSSIAPLPVDVVHLIAAGEVIDSLAAAVRELVENSLDAGATRISIAVYPDQWRVRVADNGCGMALADLQQAAAPHSTSKIRDRQDLWNIHSLGFRGEALHSLAQLSQLQIASRIDQLESSSSTGWVVTYNAQGEAISAEPVALAPGTIVTADRLFATLPARRQALPTIAQQLRAVQQLIHQMALCHPHITWQVQQGDRDWFTLFPGSSPRQILPQILRDIRESDLQELSIEMEEIGEQGSRAEDERQKAEGRGQRAEGNGEQGTGEPRSRGALGARQSSPIHNSKLIIHNYTPHLTLLLGLPDRCHRHRPDWVRVAVNGRWVQQPELEQAIVGAFRRVLPRDRHPICFVHLQLPSGWIDWNRHPAKSELYLHHLEHWRIQVVQAIDQALRLNAPNLPERFYSERVGKVLKTAETAASYGNQERKISVTGEHLPTTELSPALPLKAIAQLHSMYIVAEHPTGIWLVEQHIAHERVLYEQLCDRWELVSLSSPIILNQLAPFQVEQLQRLNLEVEPFGDQSWAVRSTPALLAQRDDCPEALWELSLGGDLQTAQVATACRSAIRNGTLLTQAEMQSLLHQ